MPLCQILSAAIPAILGIAIGIPTAFLIRGIYRHNKRRKALAEIARNDQELERQYPGYMVESYHRDV